MAENKQSLIQTLEQKRASKAWDFVNEINQKDKDTKKKYRSLALKTPVLILTNGLGQTLAFFKSKGGEHDLLYGHLSSWLIIESNIYQRGELVQKVISGDSAKYRQATAETLAFLNWLKRFAEAVLPEEGTNK
ncbi:MAG: type III-B CRISPR module-associated protein Cmr5 [Deltaproteobacteria bacterium]